MAKQEPSPRKDYYREWYQANRKRISAKRKKAYKEDKEYRERVLQQSAAHRERQRSVPRVKIPRHMVPMKYKAGDGGTVILYSIGFFSVVVGRSVQSINDWEKKGLIPKTPYIGPIRKNGHGFRYYTQSMMVVVRRIVGNKRRLFPIDVDGTCEEIELAWDRSGAPVGKKFKDLKAAIKATRTKDVEVYELSEDEIETEDGTVES